MNASADNNFRVLNLAGRPRPRLPYQDIKEKVIGRQAEAGLIFIKPELSRELNRDYRKKDRPTNVLAFRLEKNRGEIFINLSQAREEAPRFGRSSSEHVGALFIHALLHLKGFAHGSKMESEENKFFKYFFRYGKNNHHRSRRRHELGASRRLRTKRR